VAEDQGFRVLGRGKDYMRWLQTGVVTTDAKIKQKRAVLVRFLRAWNRAVKFYHDNPEVMIPYIQRRLGVKEPQMARRMYEDDFQTLLLTGHLSPEAAKEILETGKEALKIKEPVSEDRVFDFSLALEALR
jgi:ABC-type nitrate/sulfonate/bicarbonate transport system substrate-binding protein